MAEREQRRGWCNNRWSPLRSRVMECEEERSVVMKQLDPIEELYDMYLEGEDFPRIVKIVNNGLDMSSDLKDRPANLYLEL